MKKKKIFTKGLALKDLIFANDGNSKRLENGLINFAKLRMLAESVDKILVSPLNQQSANSVQF